MAKFFLGSIILNISEKVCYCSSPALGFPAQVELFKQDGKPLSVFYIERGMVKLVRTEENGDAIIVGLRRNGWHLGSPSVILGSSYPTSAITVTPVTLRCIHAVEFKNLLKENAAFALHLTRMLSAEVFQQMERMSCMAKSPSMKCVETFLWEVYSMQLEEGEVSNAGRLRIPLKYWELSQLLSVTPEYVSRLLKDLEKDGIVRRHKGWLVIADPGKLRKRVDP